MDKNIAIIGVGNCGSQVANLAEKKYPHLFDSVYINSSESDLSMIDNNDAIKFKIGSREDIEGSGKNRSKMKEYLMNDINKIIVNEDFQDIIATKKYCFIITSAAGGTGSGASPVLTEVMRQIFPDVNFILVGVLPQLTASLMEQANALEFLTELYDVLGSDTTYMIYDNESMSGLPTTKVLEAVNESIVEDLRVLTMIDNYPTPYESIDEADLESIITTPGRLLVTRVTSGLTEKAMEDTNLDDIIIKTIKRSTHAETDRNKKVLRWGVITYFTEAVNALYNSELEGLANFLGTPIERFNHNAINDKLETLNFLYLVASGLSPINDRVKKITDRIDELEKALASESANQYILAGEEGAAYSNADRRKKSDKQNKVVDKVNPADIFAKFMK